MTLEWFLALLLFISIASITPGPNNIIAMSIGFSHGYRKVIPHVLGVSVGFPVMLLLIGFVLKPIMDQYQNFFTLLKYASIAYVMYIAYQIATTTPNIEDIENNKKPITFWQSVLFQWINPKAWAGALAVVSIYIPKQSYSIGLTVAAVVSVVIAALAISFWGIMGREIKRFFANTKQIILFNYIMAILLVASVLMMLF
ncbi:MAG: LysE family translocator [Sulfurovum sp.]|nr:LysE family translocator [Sulfurovum sp.]